CTYGQTYGVVITMEHLEQTQRPPCRHLWRLHHPRLCHVIRAPPCSLTSLPTLWRLFSPPLTPILMRKACPPMCSVHCTTPCRAASSRMVSSGWAVTRATRSCRSHSAASAGGFVRRVPIGAWPRPLSTWLSRSSPGCQYANGSCRCLPPY